MVTNSGAAPVASTGSAAKIGSSTATPPGEVTPGGCAISLVVPVRPDQQIRPPEPGISLATGTKAISVAAKLSHLSPHTTYDCRLVATSQAGTSYESFHSSRSSAGR
ncbi:MAG: hypothetical protein M3065_16685 [Actinomycetota bacterium]|nr:hypothetical protein [Actinomycetota bacterium]